MKISAVFPAKQICGKRLKPLIPVLIESMERHGHLRLDEEIRGSLLRVSAAVLVQTPGGKGSGPLVLRLHFTSNYAAKAACQISGIVALRPPSFPI